MLSRIFFSHNGIISKLLDAVLPVPCIICGSVGRPGTHKGLCAFCQDKVLWEPQPHCHLCGRHLTANSICGICQKERYFFDRALICVRYAPFIQQSLSAYKYLSQRVYAPLFSHWLNVVYTRHIAEYHIDWIASIPSTAENIRQRGYPHTALLARELSKLCHRPYQDNLLMRQDASKQQKNLGKKDREKNAKTSFAMHPKASGLNDIKGSRALLIDDMLTTGQSASFCAKVLKDHGVAHVTVLALTGKDRY